MIIVITWYIFILLTSISFVNNIFEILELFHKTIDRNKKGERNLFDHPSNIFLLYAFYFHLIIYLPNDRDEQYNSIDASKKWYFVVTSLSESIARQ